MTTTSIRSESIDVDRATAILDGVVRRTPTARAGGLSALFGVPVFLKHEHAQITGSFKLRGAYTCVALADPGVRARGVVAASAGNHAQGVAYAAAKFGVAAQIFVPSGANPVKIAHTRRWGARVTEVDGGVDLALATADDYASLKGCLLVHPFDDAHVIAGQATVGVEMLADVPDLATVIVGIGGGGLISGVATALRRARPQVRIIGVQAEGAPAFARSWHAGHRLTAPARTIADGMSLGEAGGLPLELAADLLDDVVTVDEDSFVDAMVLLLREEGQVVEPAGAAGVAALLRHPALAAGPTATILSGGNLDVGTARLVETLAARPA